MINCVTQFTSHKKWSQAITQDSLCMAKGKILAKNSNLRKANIGRTINFHKFKAQGKE